MILLIVRNIQKTLLILTLLLIFGPIFVPNWRFVSTKVWFSNIFSSGEKSTEKLSLTNRISPKKAKKDFFHISPYSIQHLSLTTKFISIPKVLIENVTLANEDLNIKTFFLVPAYISRRTEKSKYCCWHRLISCFLWNWCNSCFSVTRGWFFQQVRNRKLVICGKSFDWNVDFAPRPCDRILMVRKIPLVLLILFHLHNQTQVSPKPQHAWIHRTRSRMKMLL